MTEPPEGAASEPTSAPMPDPTPAAAALRPSAPPPANPLRKFGPIWGVALLLVAVLVAIVVTSGSEDETSTPASSTTGSSTTHEAEPVSLREGVDMYSVAEAEGRADDIDWGDRCDTDIGRLKLPLWPQQECFKPFDGDNGGPTTSGVTADEIKVVIYTPQADDPVLNYVYAQVGVNDSPDQNFASFEGYAEIFGRYYETYGRTVTLQRYEATGPISDSAAAMADAETIARDLAPFAVIGGPNLTNAFADTLARNKVICISCTPLQPAEWYVERAPYVWDVMPNATQALDMVAEYLIKRVAGRPAEFAGDEALHRRDRVFGLVRVDSSESSSQLEAYFVDTLRAGGVELATIQTYESPTDLAATGKDIITALKEAGVTSVIFSGDPLAPQALTQIATQQEYFPEWILGASSLVDTSLFSQTYDQTQWAHAFGVSPLFVPVRPGTAGAAFLYEWFFGEPAPSQSVALITGPLQVLFGAIQGIGPDVEPQAFEDVLFSGRVYDSSPVNPQVSFGDRGFFTVTDYSALDDMVEMWWDPNATEVNELGREAKGHWRYVDGGARTLPGQWSPGRSALFDPAGTVMSYDRAPAGTEMPDYEPLR
ncbi:MAG: hypothetical protein M9952_09320 [Microthrixaceae bacterium]|nr:hypothetical protein [Microthrixaceae bacterium]